MKALLRAQEARTGRRNLIGRRMINTLLKAGGFIEPYTGMFSRKMEQIQEIASAGSDMSSKHGRLFTGVLDKIPVVVKIPKSPEAIRGWNRELTLTNEMAQAGIAPEVYVQSSHPHQFMIMKRYDMDVLNRMVDILESDVTPDEKIEQAGKVKAAVESLINRIIAYHKNHPRTPVCFGDFRMENIVIGKNEKGEIETRQIDFDKAFCASKSKLPNVDLKLLLMLCVTFSYNDGNQEAMRELFPPSGRIFMEELTKRTDEVRDLLERLHPLERQQNREGGTRKKYVLNMRNLLTNHEEDWTVNVSRRFPKSPKRSRFPKSPKRSSPVSVMDVNDEDSTKKNE